MTVRNISLGMLNAGAAALNAGVYAKSGSPVNTGVAVFSALLALGFLCKQEA